MEREVERGLERRGLQRELERLQAAFVASTERRELSESERRTLRELGYADDGR